MEGRLQVRKSFIIQMTGRRFREKNELKTDSRG